MTVAGAFRVLLTVLAIVTSRAQMCKNQPPASQGSVFADLSTTEMESVIKYIERQPDINVTPMEEAKLGDSYIFLVEAIRPPKTEALRFLDRNGPRPPRSARVIVFRGDLASPEVQEYRVCPLPNPSSHERLINPKWRNPIPFNARSTVTGPEEKLIHDLVSSELGKVDVILRRATDGYAFANCGRKCLTWGVGIPAYAQSNHRKLAIYLIRRLEGGAITPVGLQFVINIEGVDSTKWQTEYVWFQGQRFKTFEEMVTANNNRQLKITPIPEPKGIGTPELRSSLNFRGTPRPQTPRGGPTSQMPQGKRFTTRGRKVEWLGWEFEFSMLSSSGVQLHDIRFLGDRIAYELSLQEISVMYGGGSPRPSHSTFFDSYSKFGVRTSELFPGIDCPQHAQFFDFVHYLNGKPHTFKNGACVFEHDRGVPLRRHFESNLAGGFSFAHGMPDNVLIFRQILTVYNYDYIIDVMFHQGGQIEGKVSLSGYLLNAFQNEPGIDSYGFRLNENSTIGSIHHHIVNIKADLDIKGRKNRFETLDVSLETKTDELNPSFTLMNRKFTRNLKTTERSAAIKYNFNTPKYWIIYNENSRNLFGHQRGYRILSDAMSKVLLPSHYRGARSRAWAEYQLAVTKYKDTEVRSSTTYAQMEPFNPVMSFADFIADNERITDEDLVLWLTLGTHHIPHSEDVPIVSTPGVQLTFFLLPYNYFDEDPSLASRDNIRVTPGPGGRNNYKKPG